MKWLIGLLMAVVATSAALGISAVNKVHLGALPPTPAASSAPAATQDRAQALEKINRWCQQVHSGKLALSVKSTYPDNFRQNSTEEWRVLFDGRRSRVDQRIDSYDSSQSASTIFNGERLVRTGIRPQEVVITDLNQLRNYFAFYPYVLFKMVAPAFSHSRPLGEEIVTWKGEIAGEEKVGNLKCILLTAQANVPKNAKVQFSWWFAPEKDYALVQYAEKGSWPSGFTKNSVATVEKWRQVNNIWTPEVIVKRIFQQNPGTPEKMVATERSEVLSAEFNIALPDTDFLIK